jgi:hypothetical protein
MRKEAVVVYPSLPIWHFHKVTEQITKYITEHWRPPDNSWTQDFPSINKRCYYAIRNVITFGSWFFPPWNVILDIGLSRFFYLWFSSLPALCFPFYSPQFMALSRCTFLPLMQISLRLVTSNPPHCVRFPLQQLYFAQRQYNKHRRLICGRDTCWDAAHTIFFKCSSLLILW